MRRVAVECWPPWIASLHRCMLGKRLADCQSRPLQDDPTQQATEEKYMPKTIVGIVQAGSFVFDTTRTMESVRSYCQEAADLRARLVVFPEAFLGGYPKGMDFGARIGSRTAQGREDFRRYWESAIEVPGKEVSALGNLSRELGIVLVIGAVERDNGTLYCCVLFLGSNGELLGKHRKLMPTASERLVWGLGDGSTMPAIKTEFGTLGAAICWENYMPLFRTAMYAKGVSVWCAPTVDDREVWQSTMRHIALEGRCFVLSACQFLRRTQCPDDYGAIQGDAPDAVLINGGSVIISPLGEILAGPIWGTETVIIAELDEREIARGKFDLDVTGHYARPDIFHLLVDESPKGSVTPADLSPATNRIYTTAPDCTGEEFRK
jgi:nitrilase